jgi:PPK2 family polyphosphate:nucleotide phosphotransferase
MARSARTKDPAARFKRACLVTPGDGPQLSSRDAGDTIGLTRETVDAERLGLAAELEELQELLYAAKTHALLVILQGMDSSGKDGTIKNVMDPVNPIGVRVTSFKAPTEEELSHDFLWRVHKASPERGYIGIFNRSHYEDVLVVRVKKLVPAAIWRKRFRQINEFERLLEDTETIVLKLFLNISHEEQEERLLERERNIEKAWKLNAGDWKERQRWDDYMVAYEEAITKTSTERAPWYVVPANRKWARNHIAMSLVVDALRPHRQRWLDSLGALGKARLAEIAKLRGTRA